jgi:hypothetical protein
VQSLPSLRKAEGISDAQFQGMKREDMNKYFGLLMHWSQGNLNFLNACSQAFHRFKCWLVCTRA